MTQTNKRKAHPEGAPVSTKEYGTTPEQRTQAEVLFDKIGTGAAYAVKRPKNARVDRQLRKLISDANMSGDCVINSGNGYFRPKEDDDIAAEEYFAKERHRAREILRKVRRMEEEFNRRYQ